MTKQPNHIFCFFLYQVLHKFTHFLLTATWGCCRIISIISVVVAVKYFSICATLWRAVPPLFFRWLSSRHLVRRWEQPRDASSLSNISSWYASYQHKLSYSRENGADAAGLPIPPWGPGHVKSLWAGQTWKEAAGPTYDLRHPLWVLIT